MAGANNTWIPFASDSSGDQSYMALNAHIVYSIHESQTAILVVEIITFIQTKKTLRGLSPRANYTDRENAACRRS
jgi:hypothetical protein